MCGFRRHGVKAEARCSDGGITGSEPLPRLAIAPNECMTVPPQVARESLLLAKNQLKNIAEVHVARDRLQGHGRAQAAI